jgi:hypothetical protein
MANTNFTVHNGLTVGPLTIDAATGSISTEGSISSTSVSPTSFKGNIFGNSGTVSTSTTTGSLVVNGGAGISGNVYIGGNLQVTGTTTFVNTEVVTATEYAYQLIANGGVSSTSTTSGALQVTGGAGISGNMYVGGLINGASTLAVTGNIVTSSATDSSSTTTGSLVLAGGLGVGKNITISGNITPSANVTYNLGTATANWNNVYAVVFAGTSTTAKYADVAECYAADTNYEPGTVVTFGGDNEVTICNEDASALLAGVISTNPAYLMNSDIAVAYPAEVALLGRVPTKVKGPIKRGQMLVGTADGMARAELNPKIGTVIGKALQNFDGDTGVIEVVIGLL